MSKETYLRNKKVNKEQWWYKKYLPALKHLLPWRPRNRDKTLLPSNDAGLYGFISSEWLTPLMMKAYRCGLEMQDMWRLQYEDGAEVNSERLERHWRREQKEAQTKGREPELWRAAWRVIRTRIIVTQIVVLLQSIMQFLGPSVIMKLTLDYISSPQVDHLHAFFIVFVTAFVSFTGAAFFNSAYTLSIHTAAKLSGGIQALIYKKVLRLKTGGERLSAQVVNICNNDMDHLYSASMLGIFMLCMPVMFVCNAVYTMYIIGPWMLLGQMLTLLIYPAVIYFVRTQSKMRTRASKNMDQRVSIMTEILNSVRLIKMYAWEDSFIDTILGVWGKELQHYREGAVLQSVSDTLMMSVSMLASVASILGYTLAGNTLTAAEAFTIVSAFNAAQNTGGLFPFGLLNVLDVKFALGRVQKLLELSEHHEEDEESMEYKESNLALRVKNGYFGWEIHDIDSEEGGDKERGRRRRWMYKSTSERPTTKTRIENQNNPSSESARCSEQCVDTLYGINLSVGRRRLIGVCGSIGSGKSSLISAICGEMKVQSGSIHVSGRLALVTQQPWILNDTLRENLLLGEDFKSHRYEEVLWACSLLPDLDLLPDGDTTEIGERGINLSGGQKQRLNLARAVYSDRDIYLLDDPLSAVDSKVARHIFTKCIKGVLASKTVIFVTHATHFLEECDEVMVMHGGSIVERGSHRALMELQGEYWRMVECASTREKEEAEKEGKKEKRREGEKKVDYGVISEEGVTGEKGRLTTEETRAYGSISSRVYLVLVKACGGWGMVLLTLLAVILSTQSRLFNQIWLQIWLNQGEMKLQYQLNTTTPTVAIPEGPEFEWAYQLVYGLSLVLFLIMGIVGEAVVINRLLSATSYLHKNMLKSIFRAPMNFFDTTPSGRILNRFSRDMDEMTYYLAFNISFLLHGFIGIAGQVILVCVIYPWFCIPIAVVCTLFYLCDVFMRAGVRELKRLHNTVKSPVTHNIVSSISGISIIRTFGKRRIFVDKMYNYLDKHSVSHIVYLLAVRWFAYRMDLLSITVTVSITIICVFTKGITTTATAGLALTSVSLVCILMPIVMRMKADSNARLTSPERIIEYGYDLPSEAPREIPSTTPGHNWPTHGAIELRDVKLRYRPDLPLVLHGITASIRAGEKIGIVGRTGAGKSSLISTLLRLCELDGGVVEVDGIDISTLGLHTLRSSISVIPQDPVLFHGTIRYNIDPFDKHSDEAIWQALERSHLNNTIKRMGQGLLSKVEAGGENFSIGERQLICLTRALLRNSKIMILDEATASVDHETDALIQATIQEAFADSTVLTIAHRLNTVAAYDRIMVLDAGKVSEFASPEALMQDETSLFREMMQAMGVTTVEQMKALS